MSKEAAFSVNQTNLTRESGILPTWQNSTDSRVAGAPNPAQISPSIVTEFAAKGIHNATYCIAFGLALPAVLVAKAISRKRFVGSCDHHPSSSIGGDRFMSQHSTIEPETYFSRKLIWGFRRYVRRFVSRNFNAVRVANAESLNMAIQGPLICFVNHPGWWDPMTAVLITDEFFSSRRFFAPMDAAALKKYPILERLGFFPLDRNTNEGLKEFLRHSRTLLKDETAIFWVTPTGRFTDIREQPPFMGGLGHLAKSGPEISLLPVAVEYTFWNERYPEILIEFGPIISTKTLPTDKAKRTAMLEDGLRQAQTSLSQKAILRSPEAFKTIALGRSGIGGTYDLLRRIFAFLTGRTFQSRHEFQTDVTPNTIRSEPS